MSDQMQLLNPETMAELLGDDTELINQFKQQFLEQAHECLPKLIKEFKQSSFEDMKETAHFLKTSARAVGAEQMSYLLQDIEQNCLDLQVDALKQQIVALNQSIIEVKEAIHGNS